MIVVEPPIVYHLYHLLSSFTVERILWENTDPCKIDDFSFFLDVPCVE